MFHGNSTLEMEKEWRRMLSEGRNEEARNIRRKLNNTSGVAKLAVSRVMEKFNVVMIQEPGVLAGVEKVVLWIQKKLMRLGIIHGYDFTEELMDVAYDFEDVIDDLVLRAAAKQRGANWERCFLLIRVHKKLKMMKSKIPHLPPARVWVPCSSRIPEYLEEMEWLPLFSLPSQNLETTVVSPLKAKLSALLDLEALHLDSKRRVRRVLDELEALDSSLKGLELVDLGDKAMVWMEKLSDVCLSALVVIEDFINNNVQLPKRGWTVTSFRGLRSRKLAKEMDELRAKIQNLSISRPKEDSKTRSSDSESQESDPTSFNDDQAIAEEPDFASFADDVHGITTRLLSADKRFRVIPIIGMQGIGKRTLAKLIFNNKNVVDHFPSRAWPSTTASLPLTVGESRRVLLDIIKQLMNYEMRVTKYAGSSREIDDMMQKLEAFFVRNRFLIVMDDISNFYYRQRLLNVLAGTSNGSRMICIARNMIIPLNPKIRYDPHLLRLRADEESWALFTHALKISIPPELQEMKEKIVRRCGGLPLLIVKLAEALSQKDTTIDEWSTALQQLCYDRDKVWSNTICRIYKDLSFYMRRCLFSLTIFPHGFDIPTRRVIALWVVEDLVESEGENEAPEEVAERCLNMLIAQGMVLVTKKKLNGNVKTVRLPDALTRYWLSKAQKATNPSKCFYTRSELFPGNSMIRRLVDHLDRDDITFDHIHGGYKTSSTSWTQNYRNVLSFRSFDSRRRIQPEEEIGKFLRRCISSSCFLLLLVLDLENVYRPKLPEALGELTELRYLGLRSTFLEKLPSSIRKLQNLQTLDIKHTNINTLPNSIWELQQLRNLYLSEYYQSNHKPQPRIGCFTTLRTLCGLFVDEGTPVREGLNRFFNLRNLGLAMSSQPKAMSSQVKAVADWVQNLKHLRSLRVKSIDDNHQPWDIELKSLTGHLNLSCIYLFGRLRNPSIVSKFPLSLIDLTLSGSELIKDPMQSLKKLPNLRSLKLYAKSYLGKRMHCSRGGFPQLRVLKLWKLDQLEEWKVEEEALQALRDLEIRYTGKPLVLPEELVDRCPFLKIDVKPASL